MHVHSQHCDACCVAQQHPVSEAIFNFGGAFSFLMLPLFIYDDKGKRKVGMWTAILVRLIPLLCKDVAGMRIWGSFASEFLLH